VALYRYARHEIKAVAILEGVRTLASRPWPVGFRCGWYCVQPEMQAKELVDTSASEIEPFGNLIEGEPDDRAQTEHLKLALPLDVPSGP
jgi:hypothetical protein